MSHTPGPWMPGRPDMQTIVEGYGSKYVYSKRDNPDDESAVAIAFGRDIEEWDTIMSNARLIAAAPELLEALEFVIQNGVDDAWIMCPEGKLWGQRAELAIKKAKGGE